MTFDEVHPILSRKEYKRIQTVIALTGTSLRQKDSLYWVATDGALYEAYQDGIMLMPIFIRVRMKEE